MNGCIVQKLHCICRLVSLRPRCVWRLDVRSAAASSVGSVGAGLTNRPTASSTLSCCCLVKADFSVKKKKKEIPLQNKRKVLCAECWSTFPFRESSEGTSWLLCTLELPRSCAAWFSCSELLHGRPGFPACHFLGSCGNWSDAEGESVTSHLCSPDWW